jgi:hypothetical protein
MFFNSNTSLSMYFFCNSRIHIITLYSGHVCVYYASMLRCWHARSGACHPISHCKLARQPVVLNRKGGSSAATVVDGGRRSWRKTSAKDEGDGCKRQENGGMDSYSRFHPLFILPCKQLPIGRGASCPHRALRIPWR